MFTCVYDLTATGLLALVVTDVSIGRGDTSFSSCCSLLAPLAPLAPLLTLNSKAAVNTLGRGPSAGATEGRREAGAERRTSPRRTSVLDTATSPGLT